MNDEAVNNIEENRKLMIALFFDSGLIKESFYGGVVFEAIFKGKEINKNSARIIVSSGDIFGDSYQDISPYLVKNELCSVDLKTRSNYTNFTDWPYCWVLEDIDLNVATLIDKRLKRELTNIYKGMTTIDVLSLDVNKQFWKLLPRNFSIENNVITVFNLEEYGFAYYEKSNNLGLEVRFETEEEFYQYEIDEIMSTRTSSFVSKWEQLDINKKKMRNDIDRGIHEMVFSLVKEVSIAGDFIWKSIEDIDKIFIPMIKGIPYVTDHIFTSLYEASQGIERLQKVIVELIIYRDKLGSNDYKTLEKLLMSHNHMSLNGWIVRNEKLKPTSKKCNKLLKMLYDFYNEARYMRFGKNSDKKFEATLITKFGIDCNESNLNDEIKHLFGQAMGELTRTYYDLIHKVSTEIGAFTYEVSSETPAYIVFRNHPKDDLYETFQKIKQAKKEVIWWIAKNPDHITREDVFGEIDYLDFDPAMINSYLDEMFTNRKGSSELFDYVEEVYDERINENKEDAVNRIKIIDIAVANLNYSFDDESDEELAEENDVSIMSIL
ncbi:MAG: hypothetical protein RBT59_08200 [Arcobacteraceae bacterium]|jgi:hypothetical protein|nr:hypothetical protein [Arcobacteraceae bacterium]